MSSGFRAIMVTVFACQTKLTGRVKPVSLLLRNLPASGRPPPSASFRLQRTLL